jgi:hypothetical protein
MRKHYVHVEDHNTQSGYATVSIGDWLKGMMKHHGVSNTQLRERLLENGGQKLNLNNIAQWRNNSHKIPKERIHDVCLCLGMDEEQAFHWSREIYKAYIPESEHRYIMDSWVMMKIKIDKTLGMLSTLSPKIPRTLQTLH